MFYQGNSWNVLSGQCMDCLITEILEMFPQGNARNDLPEKLLE